MSPEEAKSKLRENNDIILLDIRTKEEYDEKHIPNCILIPLDNLNNEVENKIENKESEIIVYCRSGRRSKLACQKLVNLGYRNLYNLEGGIKNWKYETG